MSKFINDLKRGNKKALKKYKKNKNEDILVKSKDNSDIYKLKSNIFPAYQAVKNNDVSATLKIASDILPFTPLAEITPIVKFASGTVDKVEKVNKKIQKAKSKLERISNTFDNSNKVLDKMLNQKVTPITKLPNFNNDTLKANKKARYMINNSTTIDPLNGYIRMLDKLKVLDLWGLYKDEIENHIQRAGLTKKMDSQSAINYIGAAVCNTGLLDNRAYIFDSDGSGASTGFTEVLLFIDNFIDTKLSDIVEEHGVFNPNEYKEQQEYKERQQFLKDQRNARRREKRARRNK